MPGTDLTRPAGVVVIPLTGEAVDLPAASTDDLADAIDRIRGLEGELRAAKRQLADEAIARMDNDELKWTITGQDWQLSAPSPGRLEWDAEAVATVLARLVINGELPREAAERAVVAVPKVKVAGLNALLKKPEIARELEGCAKPSEAPRNVKVTRRGHL